MDISNDTFSSSLIKIIEELVESHFVSFDLEFSGIPNNRGRRSKPNLQEHYEEVKAAVEKYQILQVGLTLVKEDIKTGLYVAKPFNFNLSPLSPLPERHFTRTWSYNSGAISFLLKNHFQFDLPLTHGVPYLSRKEEHEARSSLIQEQESRTDVADLGLKKDDGRLVEHIRKSINQWQELPSGIRESSLNIPTEDAESSIPKTFNRFHIWLTHQVVRSEYPKLHSQGMGHFVQITLPAQGWRDREREREISEAVGFRWLIEAMIGGNIDGIPDHYLSVGRFGDAESDEGHVRRKEFLDNLQKKLKQRRKIFVGHNCFMDLVYLYNCFIADLPTKIEDYQEEIHALFPAIIDTKYLASSGLGRWSKTALEDLETEMRAETFPHIDIPSDFTRYQNSDIYHEAGYDSLATANVAIKLSAKIKREGKYTGNKSDRNPLDQISTEVNEFGISEDGYITAPESVAEGEDVNDSTPRQKKRLLPSVSVVKRLFGKMNLNESHGGSTEVKSFTQSSIRDSHVAEEANGDQNETEFSNSRGDWSMSDHDSENQSSPPNRETLERLLKQGKLMPRWDGERGFWQIFGNTLQVNGSKEGIWHIS